MPPEKTVDELTLEQTLEAFKFYETRADSTKAHAWAQTTWILTLNAGLLAFSFDLYANHSSLRGFAAIEWLVALAGVVLCGFLIYTLHELGSHIAHYWTSANALAAAHPALVPFIGGDRVADEANTVLPSAVPALLPSPAARGGDLPGRTDRICRPHDLARSLTQLALQHQLLALRA